MNVRRASEAGFAVPVVAVAIALISLPLMLAANLIDDAGRRLQRARNQADFEIAATSSASRLAFLMLTEPIGQRSIRVGGDRLDASGALLQGGSGWRSATGLPVREVVFDGRGYRVTTARARYPMLLSVQDEAGLLNVNAPDDAAIGRMLAGIGVDAGKARRLGGSLADFTDEDDARRLNGAEARDYRHAALPPPPNAPVDQAEAAWQAMGWGTDLSVRQQRGFLARATALPPDSRLNLNTAAPDVLRAVLGIDNRAAQRIVLYREHRAMMSLLDVAAAGGVPVPPGATPVGGLPARVFRIRIEAMSARGLRPVEARFSYAIEGDRPLLMRTLHRSASGPSVGGGEGDGGREDLPQSPALLAAR